MMNGLFLILTAAIFWGTYDVLYGKISSPFSPMLAFFVITACQALIFGIGYLFFEVGLKKPMTDKLPILLIMAILLSAGNLAFFYAFKLGTPVSVAVPVVAISITILGAIAGVVIAHEPLTTSLILGILLSISGVLVLSLGR